MFALVPGSITTPGGSATISFTIDPSQFTLPRHALTLGVDIAAINGSTIKPFISSINSPHGTGVAQAFHSIYDPHLLHAQVAGGAGTNAVLAPISLRSHSFTSPVTYTVNIQALSGSSGQFIVGFYLPGDANGDGVVSQADLQIIRGENGALAGDSRYTFDADANRDGRIGPIDLTFARQNLGVKTTVTPVVTANLDPASVTGGTGRTTSLSTVHFSGQATPGAAITYTDSVSTIAPVHTTVDPTGNYSINVPLAPGTNTFTVSAADGFGQTVTGQISPVTFNVPTPKVSAETITLAKVTPQGPQSLLP
jgi:hypothetical protein